MNLIKKTASESSMSQIVLPKRVSKLSFPTFLWLFMELNSTILKKKNQKSWISSLLFMAKTLGFNKIYKNKHKSNKGKVRNLSKRFNLYSYMICLRMKLKQRRSSQTKSVYQKSKFKDSRTKYYRERIGFADVFQLLFSTLLNSQKQIIINIALLQKWWLIFLRSLNNECCTSKNPKLLRVISLKFGPGKQVSVITIRVNLSLPFFIQIDGYRN